jgi:hypothetical protein
VAIGVVDLVRYRGSGTVALVDDGELSRFRARIETGEFDEVAVQGQRRDVNIGERAQIGW